MLPGRPRPGQQRATTLSDSPTTQLCLLATRYVRNLRRRWDRMRLLLVGVNWGLYPVLPNSRVLIRVCSSFWLLCRTMACCGPLMMSLGKRLEEIYWRVSVRLAVQFSAAPQKTPPNSLPKILVSREEDPFFGVSSMHVHIMGASLILQVLLGGQPLLFVFQALSSCTYCCALEHLLGSNKNIILLSLCRPTSRSIGGLPNA